MLKRRIDRWFETDVLVVGGSPTGVAAAVSSARLGAKTMLVEQLGILGGQTTAGLVFTPGDRLFDPKGNRLVGGFAQELIDRAVALGDKEAGWPNNGSTPWGENWIWPAAMQHVLADMLEEAGVQVVLHSKAAAALVDSNAVGGAVFVANGEAYGVTAKVTVDATGDAEVAALAGVPCLSRPVQDRRAPGIHSVLKDVNIAEFLDFVEQKEYPVWYAPKVSVRDIRRRMRQGIGFSIIGLYDFFEEGIRSGHFRFVDDIYVGPGLISLREGLVQTYWISSLNTDILDPVSLTKGDLACRKQLRVLIDYYRRCAPGFQNAYPVLLPSSIARRESRQVVGACSISEDDLKTNRIFPDSVGASLGHDEGGKTTSGHDIPYRSLVPESVGGLLVAGRCISADAVAQNSIRGILSCVVSGQAAGAAAAISVEGCVRPRDVEPELLHEKLQSLGVAFR